MPRKQVRSQARCTPPTRSDGGSMKSARSRLLCWVYCTCYIAFGITLGVSSATPGLQPNMQTALGYAAKLYPHVAPMLAPAAEHHLGYDRAVQLHKGITNTFAARERGHQLLGTLAGAVNQP